MKKSNLSESLHSIYSSSNASLRSNTLKSVKSSYTNDDIQVQANEQFISYNNWLNFLFKNRDNIFQTGNILELDTVQPRERKSAKDNYLRIQEIQTRQKAINLYRRPDILDIRFAIELDVDNKRLSFRSDPNVLLCVSLRDRLVSLLFSYSIPWLRLGLETIFGKPITSNSLSKSLGSVSETQRLSGSRRRGSEKVIRI